MAMNLSTTYHDRGLCAAARHGRTGIMRAFPDRFH